MFKINIYSEFLLGYVMKSSTLKWEHPEKQWSFKKKRRLIKFKNNIMMKNQRSYYNIKYQISTFP